MENPSSRQEGGIILIEKRFKIWLERNKGLT